MDAKGAASTPRRRSKSRGRSRQRRQLSLLQTDPHKRDQSSLDVMTAAFKKKYRDLY